MAKSHEANLSSSHALAKREAMGAHLPLAQYYIKKFNLIKVFIY